MEQNLTGRTAVWRDDCATVLSHFGACRSSIVKTLEKMSLLQATPEAPCRWEVMKVGEKTAEAWF